jgi:hypothetical protein
LLPMFAIYNIPKRKGNSEFLGLSTLYFESLYKKKGNKILLDDIAKVVLEKRRKLGPLVVGGVITSLSLLSVLLYSSSLEVVALAFFGLLLTYYGLQEYTVLNIEFSNSSLLLWLPLKVSVANIRPFVAILEYYISRRHFPMLTARLENNVTGRIIHYEKSPQPSKTSILYRFATAKLSNDQIILVNPVLLDSPISFFTDGPFIAKSEYLINSNAIVENNTVSYS